MMHTLTLDQLRARYRQCCERLRNRLPGEPVGWTRAWARRYLLALYQRLDYEV